MAVVPCPPNTSVVYPRGYTFKYRIFWESQNQWITYDVSWPAYPEFQGARTGTKGPLRFINGAKWAPCRAYERGAVELRYQPSATRYVRTARPNPRIAEWPGIPSENHTIGQNLPTFSQIGSAAGFTISSNGVPSITPSETSRLNTQLLSKAGQRQVNWGETLGESKSTLRMLVRSFSTLMRAFIAARRGKFNLVAKVLKVKRLRLPKSKTVSEKWLSYQFGWMPLMSDVYDNWKFMQRGFNSRMHVLAVSTSFRTSGNPVFSHSSWEKISTRWTKVCRAKMFYRLADSFLSRLNQVGMINPLEVAWALVPFSFVVDWAFPVGRYLEALSARTSLTFVDGYYGVSLDTMSTCSGWASTPATFLPSKNASSYSRQSTGYRRYVMASLPWPSLYIKSPFSTSHVASALALLRQLWR